MLHLGGASAVEDQIGARVQTIGEPPEALPLDQIAGPAIEGGCVATSEEDPTAQAKQL